MRSRLIFASVAALAVFAAGCQPLTKSIPEEAVSARSATAGQAAAPSAEAARAEPAAARPARARFGSYREGYDAGYQWAYENEIGGARACRGREASFADGCAAYVSDVRSERR